MTSPLVSVVIPTHNRAELLNASITSVLGQRDCDLDVIVVDDHSTDNTQEVLAGFGASIRVLRPPENVERGAARNIGAADARGSVLAFLDSDDVWEADKLSHQLPYASKGNPCVTGIRFIDDAGQPTGRTYVPPGDAHEKILIENLYLAGPSTLALPAELFQQLGGFPEERDLQGSEDWLFFAKLVHAGHMIEVVPRHLVNYRVHGGNSTAHIDRVAVCMWSATRWIEERGFASEVELGRIRARTAGTIGRQFAAQGRWRQALSWARRAMAQRRPLEGLRALIAIILSGGKGLVKRVIGGRRSSSGS